MIFRCFIVGMFLSLIIGCGEDNEDTSCHRGVEECDKGNGERLRRTDLRAVETNEYGHCIVYEKNLQMAERLRPIVKEMETAYANQDREAFSNCFMTARSDALKLGWESYREVMAPVLQEISADFNGHGHLREFETPSELSSYLSFRLLALTLKGDFLLDRGVEPPGPVYIEDDVLAVLHRYQIQYKEHERMEHLAVVNKFLATWEGRVDSKLSYTYRYMKQMQAYEQKQIQCGCHTIKQAKYYVLQLARALVEAGYTPKWLEEFK